MGPNSKGMNLLGQIMIMSLQICYSIADGVCHLFMHTTSLPYPLLQSYVHVFRCLTLPSSPIWREENPHLHVLGSSILKSVRDISDMGLAIENSRSARFIQTQYVSGVRADCSGGEEDFSKLIAVQFQTRKTMKFATLCYLAIIN